MGRRTSSSQHSVVSSSSISSPQALSPKPQPPIAYTPAHLADRIRALTITDGERKTITALFADLKGSTALIESLDPEEARSLLDPALQLMMDAVHQYDGFVAQALGDGIFALFGAPLAHEDHLQRALYAALRMQEDMRQYSDHVRLKHGVPLLMRVGVNTGEVVVRSIRKDDLHTDYVPVGHSTNLAVRMEQMANPGSIVVSEYTRKLTEGYFELKALGAATIKGVEEPLNVYEVLGAGPLRTRFQVTARRGLTRFVGRHSELEQLQRALEQAKTGRDQIVGVMSEPGLGKSRLFYEFKLTAQRGCLVLEVFAVSHGKASLYLPLIELLKTYFQIEPMDDERTRRQKVLGHVLDLDRSLEDTLPSLFSLLGIEDEQSSLQQMDAQIRRRRTFDALKKLLLRESLNQPLILLFEDLHWIDTETQGFLDALIESMASAHLLLLVNYRPEYQHAWGQKTYYTQLRLVPLGHAEAEELLTFLLGNAPSLKAVKQLILEKTEGTPFFMEEVVHELVEQGVLVRDRVGAGLVPAQGGRPQGSPLQIPTTVQAVLAARIDRLTAEEKALLQQLSVIGRQFPVSLVKQVVTEPEAELYRILASLQAKEFLYEQPAFPESEYLFKHALTQEVAYGMVLQEQRKALHEKTAEAMEALYKDNLNDHCSELARHYQQSGNVEKAVEYLGLAGRQALEHFANTEAINLLTAALNLLRALPEMPEHLSQELNLLITLSTPLLTTRGFTAAELEQALTRALALCQQLDSRDRRFPVLRGLWEYTQLKGRQKQACELAEELFGLAQQLQDADLRVVAHAVMADTLCWLGDFSAARDHAEQTVSLYTLQRHHSLIRVSAGSDPGVTSYNYTAFCQWFLGYPDRALETSRQAIALASDIRHPFSQAIVLFSAVSVTQFCGQPQLTLEYSEDLLVLAHEQGFPFFIAWGEVLRSWARAQLGQPGEVALAMHQAVAAYDTREVELLRSWFYTLLAEQYRQAGLTEEGLDSVHEALDSVQATGERWYEAEVKRVEGELLLNEERRMVRNEGKTTGRSRQAEAEACFQQALAVARQQQAKSLELRAATSLARLWQRQGKTTEARDPLAPVYEWFTEGFDTADLKDAKALLDSLS